MTQARQLTQARARSSCPRGQRDETRERDVKIQGDSVSRLTPHPKTAASSSAGESGENRDERRPKGAAQGRKPPRKMNPARLERIAVAHLQRFGSSAANLKRVLRRRIERSCEHHGDDPADFEAPLDELIARLEDLDFLDDRRYGASLLRSARARGASTREIRVKLRHKGLDPALCDELLKEEARKEGEAGQDADFESAWRYARRRRLGPFRRDADLRLEHRQRDLAALGRRGFGYPVACRVIDADDLKDEAGQA